MEKIKNSLYLNYERVLGKSIDVFAGGYHTDVPSSNVKTFYELLVPGTSDLNRNMLTAIGNALFIEARKCNMSLSPFGHLDPIKFVVASVYLPLMLMEVKRDLGIATTYHFGSTAYGPVLARAAHFNLTDALNNLAEYCKQYNVTAAKLNALFVPVSGLVQRWLEHRLCVYKDDEGDRYSFYMYNMANYYQLITDPLDPEVGQVLFKSLDGTGNETIATKLTRINTLIDTYAGDEDFAEFCTEAVQAKMSRLCIEPIKSNADEWEFPKLIIKYKLDDIMSLENATFVAPTWGYSNSFTGATHWNIIEDVNGQLIMGSCAGYPNRLPVVNTVPSGVTLNQQLTKGLGYLHSNAIENRFIFTHAKVKSEIGLTNLTRYVNSFGARSTTISASGAWYGYVNGKTYSTSVATNIYVGSITCYGTELLAGMRYFWSHAAGAAVQEDETTRVGCWYTLSPADPGDFRALLKELNAFIGFKPRLVNYLINYADGSCSTWISDYDYITTVTSDTLSSFNGVNAWNDIQLIHSFNERVTESKDSNTTSKSNN